MMTTTPRIDSRGWWQTRWAALGRPIFDPYATIYAEGGFDLEAVGIIHAPEPGTALGLIFGLLGLCVLAKRSKPRSVLGALVAVAMLGASPGLALIADFEDLGLGAESLHFPNGFLDPFFPFLHVQLVLQEEAQVSGQQQLLRQPRRIRPRTSRHAARQ